MAVERGGRGCAIAALAIASTSAALCGAFITYGGYKAFDLSARVANADTVVSEYKSYAAHLSAQLQQLQRVDTTLGARLQAVEASVNAATKKPLAAGDADDEDGEKKRKRGKARAGGKTKVVENAAGSDKAKETADGDAKAAGDGQTPGGDTSNEEQGDDDSPKGKGRKGKRKKKRHG